MKASINPNKCLQCEKCFSAEACPTKAIFKVELDGPAVIEQEYCYGCGDCIEKCPAKAIILE